VLATRRRTRRAVLRAAPWVAIPLIIAAVQVVRGEAFDATLFAVVAVLLALDLTGVLPEPPAVRLPLAPVIAAGVVVVGALTLAPRHGVVAGLIVAAVGIAGAVIAWTPTRATVPPDRARLRRGAVLWAGVAVALCLWELSSFLLGRDTEAAKLAHPAVSDLLDPALDDWAGRLVFAVLWVAAGIGLLRAGRRQ
jgi:hypothetical protein